MSDRRPKIVVTMIVKNEAHVIERCLRSLRPVMDAYCIVDTGSTDGTQDVIKKAMAQAGIPGEVHEIPWKNFAYNRSKALELARPLGDYSLMIDADEEAFFVEGFDPEAFRASLTADVYNVMFRNGCLYVRPQLTSTRKPFVYRAVLHEFLEAPPGAVAGGNVESFHIRSTPDGARSGNPRKYQDDAELLEAALARNDEPEIRSRYVFYCAQSHRDCGNLERAFERYVERASMGGWPEEVYVSWMWAGRIGRAMGRPIVEVLDLLNKAHDVLPQRAEALCWASVFAREAGRLPLAFLYARRATELKPYDTALFLEPEVYSWRARYELSIACCYVGESRLGLTLSQQLLAEGLLPTAESDAVRSNIAAYDRLLSA